MIARRVLGGAIALLLLVGATACTAPAAGGSGSGDAGAGPTPTDAAASAPAGGHASDAGAATGIRLLGPDEPVPFDGEYLPVVVEVTGPEGPLVGAEVTFTVVSGPAEFTAGFESSTTDETGVTAALMLMPTGPGDVVLRVASGPLATEVTVTVAP